MGGSHLWLLTGWVQSCGHRRSTSGMNFGCIFLPCINCLVCLAPELHTGTVLT